MKIIGWDIGERHLAYTIIDYQSSAQWYIEAANVTDFIGDSGISYTRNPAKYMSLFYEKLAAMSGVAAVEYVIIEKQPPLNSRIGRYNMHVIMNCLIYHYVSNKFNPNNIFLMDSREKFAIDPLIGPYPRGSENYDKRKKLAVTLAHNCLKSMPNEKNNKYCEIISRGGRNSDWCDALTQALHFCNYSLNRAKII